MTNLWKEYLCPLFNREKTVKPEDIDEMIALDDLVEGYSSQLETNSLKLSHLKDAVAKLEKENERLNSKIAVAIRKIKELENESVDCSKSDGAADG